MESFNLADRGWIPCSRPETTLVELGLRDALVQAHELRGIDDASPLVTAALHRLLLAVLYRAFEVESSADWRRLWSAGTFDCARVDAYLREEPDRHERFELFHPQRPFYQVPPMFKARSPAAEAELHPVQRLAQEAASGNNATLFDHSRRDRPRALSPAEAARYLVAAQAYSLGFGISEPFSFKDAPLTRGYSVLIEGRTLFETLMLNLLPLRSWRQLLPSQDDAEDLPAWEQPELRPPDPAGTAPCGPLDYLTFQARRVHLVQDSDGFVRHCQVLQNVFLPRLPQLFDPFKAYRKDEQAGWVARGFQPERALWRDSEALLEDARDGSTRAWRRPEVFEHLAWVNEQRQNGAIVAQPSYSISVSGFATDPGKAASVTLWRRERLPLPLIYLDDEKLLETLRQGLRLAEDVAAIIDRAARRYATLMCVPNWDRLSEPERQVVRSSKQAQRQIDQLARELRPGIWYWPRLDPLFRSLLARLPGDRREDGGDVSYVGSHLIAWARAVEHAARDAFAAAIRGAAGGPRSLKAMAIAQDVFQSAMAAVMAPYERSGRGTAA